MKKVSQTVIIETARRYGIAPAGMKCQAFALFDQGFSRQEVRYLPQRYRKPEDPFAFSNTLRRYHRLWQEMQADQGDRKGFRRE